MGLAVVRASAPEELALPGPLQTLCFPASNFYNTPYAAKGSMSL